MCELRAELKGQPEKSELNCTSTGNIPKRFASCCPEELTLNDRRKYDAIAVKSRR